MKEVNELSNIGMKYWWKIIKNSIAWGALGERKTEWENRVKKILLENNITSK